MVIVHLSKKEMRLVSYIIILRSPSWVFVIHFPLYEFTWSHFILLEKSMHFTNPFYNFSQGLMSGSLIYNRRTYCFPLLKICTCICLSPLLHHSSEVTIAGSEVSSPTSFQPCSEIHLSQGT